MVWLKLLVKSVRFIKVCPLSDQTGFASKPIVGENEMAAALGFFDRQTRRQKGKRHSQDSAPALAESRGASKWEFLASPQPKRQTTDTLRLDYLTIIWETQMQLIKLMHNHLISENEWTVCNCSYAIYTQLRQIGWNVLNLEISVKWRQLTAWLTHFTQCVAQTRKPQWIS